MEVVATNAQMDGDSMTKQSAQNAVMALSGGMDSSSLLLRLLREHYNVTALSFNYGQKHLVEIDRATALVSYLQQLNYPIKHHILDLSNAMQLFHSDLLSSGGDVPQGHYEEETMKSTVVPNRNAIFSSLLYGVALSIAEKCGDEVDIVLGVHSGDHAIYPDCRPEFYAALEHAFTIGNWNSEKIHFRLPYLHENKTDILRDAQISVAQLNLDFDEVFSKTITSYNPDSNGRSDGKTGSDVERILAFHALGRRDPIEYIRPWDEILASALAIEKEHLDQKYKLKLDPLSFHITRESGTERAFTGQYWDEHRHGQYFCICCDTLLFESTMKFDSGCGWPSFHSEHRDAKIERIADYSHGMRRMEVRCSQCKAHLGHVFPDGPKAFGGERYCINSASLHFIEKGEVQ